MGRASSGHTMFSKPFQEAWRVLCCWNAVRLSSYVASIPDLGKCFWYEGTWSFRPQASKSQALPMRSWSAQDGVETHRGPAVDMALRATFSESAFSPAALHPQCQARQRLTPSRTLKCSLLRQKLSSCSISRTLGSVCWL